MELANCPHPWFLLGWFFSWQKKCRLQHVVKNISPRINTHWVADEDFGAAPFTKGGDCMRCVWTQNGRMTVIQRLSFKKDTNWNIIFLKNSQGGAFSAKISCVLLASLSQPSMKSLALDALLAPVGDVPASCFAACTTIINTKLMQWPRTRSSACHHSEFVLFSTVRCAFQHGVLCFSARCVVLFSTVCCAFQHSALCFSAQCVVLFSTVRCAFQHNVLSLSAQCQVQALFKAPRLGTADCPSLWRCCSSFLKNQDRNDLSISQ